MSASAISQGGVQMNPLWTPLGETRLNCIKFSVPTKADLCEYYVNLEANTFDTFKVEPSLMTVFEQSHTWDELIRHFVDSYVVETDKKAVSSFYDRGYIAERWQKH